MPNKNKTKLPEQTKGSAETDSDRADRIASSAIEVLPPEAQAKLKELGIDPDDPKVRSVVGVTISSTYFGPIPPPSMFSEYEKVRPGIVDKIIQWNDMQIQHRHALENRRSERTERRMDRGQFLAISVAIIGLIIAGVVGVYGNAFAASVIALVAVGGPTTAVALSRFVGPSR